jgi:hypothetical protein
VLFSLSLIQGLRNLDITPRNLQIVLEEEILDEEKIIEEKVASQGENILLTSFLKIQII